MRYEIYKNGNVFYINDTTDDRLYEGLAKNVLLRRESFSSTDLYFTGVNGFKDNKAIPFSEVIVRGVDPFTDLDTFISYIENNTGFNSSQAGEQPSTSVSNTSFGESERQNNNLIITNPNDFKVKGGFYYPIKAVNPDWVSELARTDIPEVDRLTFTDIENDLDLLVSNNLNTVRIVLQYNLETFGTNPLFDINNNVDSEKEQVLVDFIALCRSKSLKVITQTNFGYEGELSASDLTEISDYNTALDDTPEANRFNTHIDWLTNIIKNNSDVIIAHKMFNEPDGFGTWSNNDTAVSILTFLGKIKERFITGYSNIPYIVNAVTHVNFNVRFLGAPLGVQSLYEVSDFAAFNSYYWADNGFFQYTHYRRQFQFMSDNNYLNKPIIMMEFGYPSDYDGQDYVNEEDQDESFVPANGQFDRPLGNNSFMPHTQESQDRATKEAVFFSEEFDTVGLLCWSLFKHEDRLNLGKPSFFQDSFGFIGSDGSDNNTSIKMLQKAYTERFDSDNLAPFSITAGETFGGAHINGDQGYNVNDVPAGVYIPTGGGYKSNTLNLKTPYKLNVLLNQTTQPVDNGAVLGLEFVNSLTIQFRFEDYSNRWRMFLIDGNGETEVANTLDQTGNVLFDFTTNIRKVTFDLSSNNLKMFVDGVEQLFYESGNQAQLYNYSLSGSVASLSDIKLICNATTADIKLREVFYNK